MILIYIRYIMLYPMDQPNLLADVSPGGSSFSAPERQQNGCLLGLRAVAQKLWETVEGIAARREVQIGTALILCGL